MNQKTSGGQSQRRFEFIAEGVADTEGIIQKLNAFKSPFPAGHWEPVAHDSAVSRAAVSPVVWRKR